MVRVQPVPFSHEHHVGVLGIDCRYCHTVGRELVLRRHAADQDLHELPFADLGRQRHARAGARQLPHRPVAALAARLQPARLRLLRPQHPRPQGRSAARPATAGSTRCRFTYQVPSLLMEWCLDCHRHPERQLRPRERGLQHRNGSRRPISSSCGRELGEAVRHSRHPIPHQLLGVPPMNPRKNLCAEARRPPGASGRRAGQEVLAQPGGAGRQRRPFRS